MIDFHTHILPNIDDGSRSLEESLALLREEAQQGVEALVLTPHYYAHRHSPEEFLRRRQQSWELLSPHLEPGMPRLLLGAEVRYFEGICGAEALAALRVQGTQLLLLEMPMGAWTSRMIRNIQELNGRPGIQVVLAHIERYLPDQKRETIGQLLRCGVKLQASVDWFCRWTTRRRAMEMLRRGELLFLGSDCHDRKDRRPNWDRLPEEARRMARDSQSKLARYQLSAADSLQNPMHT